ncbi:ABC transporter ATP-binding protein [Bacillus mojavensis]|uniref:ABC transporter ATP-binding protein n=1 Tax=Bacillus TaxID=1386 RepID=UPI002DBCD65A|nr:ABC transporter ATP-binding protein [Bacillus mojavensis]MEC1738546.1 ABC transporter ATP-binding protein [Bacillus mojavensis]MEC1795106.1 ABC transporter ATP-binding protein [Bacillus mojavensis]
MISAEKISKIYNKNKPNELKAIKEIDLHIEKGEFCTIIGKSGSGKTTLLKCLSGIERISDGQILVDNVDINKMSSNEISSFRKSKIGFVFQEYNLIDDLTLHENIYLDNKASCDIEDLIDLWDIRKAIDLFPSQCSGGQQQKAAILRAIVRNVDILFCDEPTGALDGLSSKEVLTVMQDLQKNYKTTIVLITHNELITKISDTIITINNGDIRKYEKNSKVEKAENIEW